MVKKVLKPSFLYWFRHFLKTVLAWEREARAKGIVRGRVGECQRASGCGECKGERVGARSCVSAGGRRRGGGGDAASAQRRGGGGAVAWRERACRSKGGSVSGRAARRQRRRGGAAGACWSEVVSVSGGVCSGAGAGAAALVSARGTLLAAATERVCQVKFQCVFVAFPYFVLSFRCLRRATLSKKSSVSSKICSF